MTGLWRLILLMGKTKANTLSPVLFTTLKDEVNRNPSVELGVSELVASSTKKAYPATPVVATCLKKIGVATTEKCYFRRYYKMKKGGLNPMHVYRIRLSIQRRSCLRLSTCCKPLLFTYLCF